MSGFRARVNHGSKVESRLGTQCLGEFRARQNLERFRVVCDCQHHGARVRNGFVWIDDMTACAVDEADGQSQ